MVDIFFIHFGLARSERASPPALDGLVFLFIFKVLFAYCKDVFLIYPFFRALVLGTSGPSFPCSNKELLPTVQLTTRNMDLILARLHLLDYIQAQNAYA